MFQFTRLSEKLDSLFLRLDYWYYGIWIVLTKSIHGYKSFLIV